MRAEEADVWYVSTRGLSLDQRGLLASVIAWCDRTELALPDDMRKLASQLGTTEAEIERLWDHRMVEALKSVTAARVGMEARDGL